MLHLVVKFRKIHMVQGHFSRQICPVDFGFFHVKLFLTIIIATWVEWNIRLNGKMLHKKFSKLKVVKFLWIKQISSKIDIIFVYAWYKAPSRILILIILEILLHSSCSFWCQEQNDIKKLKIGWIVFLKTMSSGFVCTWNKLATRCSTPAPP